MVTLAMPVVIAELGWIAMGIVDTLMVGPLGPEAIGAVGIGSPYSWASSIFAMGLMLGLDTLVSHAYRRRPPRRLSPVAGARDRCSAWSYRCRSRWCCSTSTLLAALGPRSRGLPIDSALSRCAHVERGAAPPVRDVPPLSAGHGRRAASDDRSGDGQRHQRDRQLDSHLWKARRAGHGRTRVSVGDGDVARGDGAYLLVVIVLRERGRRPGLFETSLRD